MKSVYLTISLIFIYSIVYTQTIKQIGNPYIQNYTKAQYKAGNQNWAIAQGKDGVIYSANNNGLLAFDGSYWEIYPLENKNDVRSVAISPIGDIYVGGKEEFGVFQKKDDKLIYKKISNLIKSEILENDEIWKIIFVKDIVVFQSFSKLYIYKNNKIEVLYGQGEPFLFAHQIDNKIWIEKIPSGLQNFDNNRFQPIENKLSNVLTILPFDKDKHLIGTAKDGLFLLNNNGSVQKWEPNNTIDQILKEAQINNGLKIGDNLFAFGTIKNGIFIINNKGNIVQHLHKRNGLQNNTVLSLTLDQQCNIWAGLDNGIDRIEINSPFYYYKDIFGELGTVYAIKIFDNKIYLGTNQGLFYSPWSQNNTSNSLNLKFIPGSQGQVWSLEVFNNQLICGHNDGTYLVTNDKIHKISNYTGGWVNKQISASPNNFIQGNYTGLASFTQLNTWQVNQKFPNPKNAVIDLIEKDKNQFWVIHHNAIQLVTFSNNFQTLEIVKTFSFKEDFPQIQRISPYNIEGNILFATDKGMFIYDNVLSKFKPYEELNKTLGTYAKSKKIKKTGNNKYMFANEGRFAHMTFNADQLFVDSSSYNILENIVMKNHEIVEPFENKLIFGLDNGIAIYDKSLYKAQKLSPPIIKGYQHISTKTDYIHPINNRTVIQNNKNSIRILFSSPWFSSDELQYQYKLNGYSQDWSTPSETPFVDYTNLNWGTYTFEVKAISSTGEISERNVRNFKIAAPWYATWQAVILYIIIIIITYYIVRKLILQKIALDKQKISEKIRLQQEELLRKETEQNEKKLMALKNEQLSQELELKSRELANAATNILYKNELLNNLHEELLNVKDKEGKKLSNDQLQKVNKLIHNAKSDERDWDVFEKSFNESHENFFKKLKVDYPTLSPNDLKLCAYLRLNMSSKDIASLINISIRGIEIRRYRLRKKFNLPTDKNLNEFLMEL